MNFIYSAKYVAITCEEEDCTGDSRNYGNTFYGFLFYIRNYVDRLRNII